MISAAILLVALWHPAADAAEKTMWRLEQSHISKGKASVLFTADAVKFTTPRGGQYVSRAPLWDVYAYRTDDKTICHLTRKEFYTKMGFHPSRANDFSKVGTAVICSRPVRLLSNGQSIMSVADFPGIPPEVGDFLGAWLREPGGGGVVLKSVAASPVTEKKIEALVLHLDQQKAATVATKSVQLVPYNRDAFTVPTGFRIVKRLEDTYYSAAGQKDLESIVEQLGVGESLGKK